VMGLAPGWAAVIELAGARSPCIAQIERPLLPTPTEQAR
jgi:hypothetical protein